MPFHSREVSVDRLFLESFSNEQSPYFADGLELSNSDSIKKLRNRLRWHINNSLSTRQKEVLKHYLTGKKEREIAGILGVTQQVVNIYKHRAFKKLRKLVTA